MKKIKILLISLVSIFAFSINVCAASGSLSVSSGNVYVGDTFRVTANISSAAAWNVHVTASGPVSGCTINQADATSDAMDTNKSFSATCTATGTGTITVRLSGDVTSASNGNAVGISGTRNVTVTTRPNIPSNNNNNSNNGNNYVPSNNSNPTANNNDKRSKNNNIKELSIDGYELIKVDNNNYTLSVPNDVTSINVKATLEDSKSKVTGIGQHDINVGENNIEVVVTAENGLQNKINIKVTRKDGYYLEDLDSVLKNSKVEDINITIKSDTKITAQDLEKIKKSKKTVKLNYYNEDKFLMYSWFIDGTKLGDTKDFVTTVSFDSENKKDILRLSNYADGLFISLKQINNFPKGTKIKLYVGDKYAINDEVNIYLYNKNKKKLNIIGNNVKVKEGYIEFDIGNGSDYLVTMSNIPSIVNKEINSSNNLSLYIIIPIALIIILIIIICILKKKKGNKSDKNISNDVNREEIDIKKESQNEYNNQDATNLTEEYNKDNSSEINFIDYDNSND